MIQVPSGGKFPIGILHMTRGVVEVVSRDNRAMTAAFTRALCRHMTCDWGIVSDDDKKRNDQALVDGARLFSAYLFPDDTKFWIITEADRSSTAIMLPDEY